MTLSELQQKANPVLLDFWNTLQARQDAYFAKHGRYFQLLVSPEIKVIDGVDSTFSVRTPSYEQNIADYQLTYSALVPFQIEVHQYKSPNSFGYIAIVTAELLDGRTFKRSRTSEGVDSGWYEHKPVGQ
jgi:hypothetical protein